MRNQIEKRGRMCIYANDVVIITGRSYKTSLRILNRIREAYNKPIGALVTYMEFCAFMNLDEEEVLEFLK